MTLPLIEAAAGLSVFRDFWYAVVYIISWQTQTRGNHGVTPVPDDYTALRAEAEAALRSARRALAAEIRAYPGPIAGCDAQYTHILAERRRLQLALDALGAEVFVPTPRNLHPNTGIEGR